MNTHLDRALGSTTKLEDGNLKLAIVVGRAAGGSLAVGLQVVGGSLGHGHSGGSEAESSSRPLHYD